MTDCLVNHYFFACSYFREAPPACRDAIPINARGSVKGQTLLEQGVHKEVLRYNKGMEHYSNAFLCTRERNPDSWPINEVHTQTRSNTRGEVVSVTPPLFSVCLSSTCSLFEEPDFLRPS